MLLTIAITVALIFLALCGMPIFAVIAATALVGFYLSDIEVTVVAIELFRFVDSAMLVALPLFTLTGYLLAESNASQRLRHRCRIASRCASASPLSKTRATICSVKGAQPPPETT